MEKFNDIQNIKRQFFAMRNGIVADTLKNARSPYRMIFGLNLPQLVDIAASIGKNKELALKLIADSNTRESQLLAPMIMPSDEIESTADAILWIDFLKSEEAVDISCLKLLKNCHDPVSLAKACSQRDDTMSKYAALRLLWNIYPRVPRQCLELLDSFALDEDDSLRRMAQNLKEEIEYITGD